MISLKNIISRKKEPEKADTDAKTDKTKTSEKKENIFGQTLKADRTLKTKKTEYIQAKNKKKALMTLGVSVVLLAVYSVFFFYENTAAYLKAPAQIAELQGEIEEYNEITLPELKEARAIHKAAYDEEFEAVLKALDTVFPEGIDKLGIVRLFESFATEVAASFPPFEFTSINLGAPEERNGYVVIPVSTSIYSSLAGFDKFLTLVDRSGYIYSGEEGEEDREVLDKQIRLMSISNISIKYRGVDEATGQDQGVDFSVKLNVYSRSANGTQN